MTRGYAMIGLYNPKDGENVGGTMRAAGVYGASGVIIDGPRRNNLIAHPTNTMRAERGMPVQWCDDIFELVPYGCVPVAVDLLEGAESLVDFRHPHQALYIFGAEDATLGEKTITRCARKLYVPTRRCMNLAATVNVVLYDRMAKQSRSDK